MFPKSTFSEIMFFFIAAIRGVGSLLLNAMKMSNRITANSNAEITVHASMLQSKKFSFILSFNLHIILYLPSAAIVSGITTNLECIKAQYYQFSDKDGVGHYHTAYLDQFGPG